MDFRSAGSVIDVATFSINSADFLERDAFLDNPVLGRFD